MPLMIFFFVAYMDYHPGGCDELSRGAGIDATDLFNEVHRWVNYESMLKVCLVGKYVNLPVRLPRSISSNKKEENKATMPLDSIRKPSIIPPIIPSKRMPDPNLSHDWYQTNNCVIVSLYTKRKSPKYSINSENILVDINEKSSNEKKGKITENRLS